MSAFLKLKATFDINWTTILVGWNGFGAFSPWPDRSDEFPPFLSPDELMSYANERLGVASNPVELDNITRLFSIDLHTTSRQQIRSVLTVLSNISSHDANLEIRKWRVVLLEDLLCNLPNDEIYGLTALTDFWQHFGFPADGPHEVQQDYNASDYYQQENLQRLVARHRAWIDEEKKLLISSSSK